MLRANTLLRALLFAALAESTSAAASRQGTTAAAAAAVAVAGSLSDVAAPAAGASPLSLSLTGRRPARLGAPPVRLSFTAAFGALSEGDLVQNNNSDIFLPALVAAVTAAASGGGSGAGVAVSIADIANVGLMGDGWGALHVRLAVTFPPGTRPGARALRHSHSLYTLCSSHQACRCFRRCAQRCTHRRFAHPGSLV
jgi:hypothetical protein